MAVFTDLQIFIKIDDRTYFEDNRNEEYKNMYKNIKDKEERLKRKY